MLDNLNNNVENSGAQGLDVNDDEVGDWLAGNIYALKKKILLVLMVLYEQLYQDVYTVFDDAIYGSTSSILVLSRKLHWHHWRIYQLGASLTSDYTLITMLCTGTDNFKSGSGYESGRSEKRYNDQQSDRYPYPRDPLLKMVLKIVNELYKCFLILYWR